MGKRGEKLTADSSSVWGPGCPLASQAWFDYPHFAEEGSIYQSKALAHLNTSLTYLFEDRGSRKDKVWWLEVLIWRRGQMMEKRQSHLLYKVSS